MIGLQWILGAVLLVLGRKLFWFFVGAVGFVTGLGLAGQWLEGRSELLILLVGVVAGILGALLALALQRVALAVAGFFAGGYVAVGLLELIGWEAPRLTILPFLIGGVIGGILLVVLFDWALIVLSSLTGASMIVQAMDLGRPLAAIVLLVLVGAGIVVQAGILRREKSLPPPDEPSPA